ncbi:MAG: CheB methylesterase domain-containing protein, partial [Bdellovibrionota bacterium]
LKIEGGQLPEVEAKAGREGEPPGYVVVGASTGGPAAIHYVIDHLPAAFSSPIAIAQHMPEGFTRPFAERLARRTDREVREARDGDVLEPGLIVIAPGGTHLELAPGKGGVRCSLVAPKSDDRFVPSVDRLFVSAAKVLGEEVVGLVLTGMGNDGLAGARAIRGAGGTVLVESEETAIVYGMPREVAEAGHADRVLPLSAIPRALGSAGQARARARRTRGKA